MSVVWMIGGVFYYFRRERKQIEPPVLSTYPPVSIVLAAYNEADIIRSTVSHLFKLDYPSYEIIVVDDCSTDQTATILRELAGEDQRLRLVLLDENIGKAAALNVGVRVVNHEIIISIDADSYLDHNALKWLVWHFEKGTRTGAVTGNPRVLNRTSLLSKIQAAEYSSIIGLIKRTQRIIGKVMTVSGVLAAFRRTALVDIGYWDTDCVTEDIDITWKLEKKLWDVRYEAQALIWILVPETLRGFWRQRVRWSQGAFEVLRKHREVLKDYRLRRLWIIYFDALVSSFWAVLFFITLLAWIVNLFIPHPFLIISPLLLWWGAVLAVICLLQFFVAITLDRRYDPTLYRTYFWIIWYPMIYWIFNCLANVYALPLSLFTRFGQRRTKVKFSSPDRGIMPVHDTGGKK